jgi:hypothetical protein
MIRRHTWKPPFIGNSRASPRAVSGRSGAPRKRLVVSPAQLGGTRREVPGSDGLPQVRKDLGGPEHARKAAAVPRRTGRCAAGPAEYGESWIARSQISSRCKPPSTGKTSEPVPCPALVSRSCRRNLRGTGRCPVRAFKEMSGPPTFRSTRTTGTNAGSPTGRESYGDGGPVVVAGVTTCQGVRESRTQDEGGQVTGHQDREVRVMRNAEADLDALCGRVPQHGHWRARCSETGTAGSGRGPLEKMT